MVCPTEISIRNGLLLKKIIQSVEGLNKTKRQRMGQFTIFVWRDTPIFSCPWSSVLLVFRAWDADQCSLTFILEHLPSQTVRFSTKMFMKKWLGCWTQLGFSTQQPFSCCYLYDQSHISQETNKGENKQVCQYNTKPCAINISENCAVNILMIVHRNWQLRSLVL